MQGLASCDRSWVVCGQLLDGLKKDPPTVGELSSQTPFSFGLHGSGLDKVAEKTPERETGLMNSPYFSKKEVVIF